MSTFWNLHWQTDMRKERQPFEVAQNLDLREELLSVEDDHIFLHNLGRTNELCWGLQNIPTQLKRLEAQRYEHFAQAEWNMEDKMILTLPTSP